MVRQGKVKKPRLPKDVSDKYLKRIHDITNNKTEQYSIHTDSCLTRQFIKNKQWKTIDASGNIVEIPQDLSYKRTHRKPRQRITENIMFPVWRTYKSHLIQNQPRPVARPSDPDDVNDLIGARVATKVMEYLYEAFMKYKRDRLLNYVLIYGTAFLHPIWNPETKRCEIKLIPPTQIYAFPQQATSWDQVLGIAWKRGVHKDILAAQYPDKEFKGDTDSFEDFYYYEKAGVAKPDDKTSIIDYWELPFGDSKGIFLRTTKTEILESIDHFPYKNQDSDGEYQLPFNGVYDNKLDDGIFGWSTIGMLKNTQKDYNRGLSRLAQLRELMPKLIVDQEGKIRLSDLIDEDSTMIEYSSQNQANPPLWTQVPAINPILAQDVFRKPEAAEHIGGFHEITLRSEAPGSVQSGYGIRTLMDKDEGRLATVLGSYRDVMVTTFNQLYSLVVQYYDDKTIRRILGDKGELDILTFRDIPLSPMTFIVSDTVYTPYSQTYRQELMLKLLPLGIFNIGDPIQRRQIYEYLDTEMASRFDPTSNEYKLAKWENKELLENQIVEIHTDDVDEIHINVLNEIRKDFRFNDMPKRTQEKINKHYEDHQMQGQEKMKQSLQLMKMAQTVGGDQSKEKVPQGGGIQ